MSVDQTSHDWFTEQIAIYLANGLNAPERERFESHANECVECAKELEETRRLEQEMTDLFVAITPGVSFENRVLNELRRRIMWREPVRIPRAVRRAAVAAAAVIVLGGFGLVGQNYIESGRFGWPGFDSKTALVMSAARLDAPAPLLNHLVGQVAATQPSSPGGRWAFGGGANPAHGWSNWDDTNGKSPTEWRIQQQRQAISYSYETALSDADKATQTHDFSAAQAAVERARVARGTNPGAFSEDETRSFDARIANSQQMIDRVRKDYVAGYLPAREDSAKQLAEQQKVTNNEVRRTVGDLIRESRKLTQEGRYKQALGVTDQILKLDPNNDYAQGARPLIEDRAVVLEQRQYRESYDHNTTDQYSQAEGKKVPYGDILTYPKTWPDFTGKSDHSVTLERGERVEPQPVAVQLEKNLPEVRLDGVALGDAIDFMRDAGGSDMYVDWKMLEKQGITKNTPVTAQLKDVKFSDALKTVLDSAGAGKVGYTINDGVIEVSSVGPDAPKTQPVNANPVPAPQGSTTAPTTNVGAPIRQMRMVIREGTMEFEVDSFDSAFGTIGRIIAEEGGFIASADSDKLPNGKVRGSVVVRVPPDRLDTLVLKLRALGELKSQRLGSRDISKDYTDLESELRAARAMESRLLEMIKTAQGKVKDLLDAEKELGNWREKIEKIQGQMNYYSNLVSMATLTINAYERDIKAPASASQTEEINAGVETDDVEHARSEAIKSIETAKGRILESTLQQLEAGQLAAKIVAEVSPDQAGPILDRLRQLGKIARLDIQRKQTDSQQQTPGTGSLGVRKVEQAPTKLVISMYNLANVAPRLTTNMSLAGEDVEATYRAILSRVNKGNGRVISSSLERQDAQRAIGKVQFELKSADADAVLNDIRGASQVLAMNVTENPDTANVTTAKQAFTVQVIPASQVPPRETRALSVQTAAVESTMQTLSTAATTAGGRAVESSLSQDASGTQTARLVIELPLSKADGFIDQARSQGTVRTAESTKNTQIPEGPLARARITLSIGNGEGIVPAEQGFWRSIREGLSTSVKGLLWSLELIVIGLCLVAPWVLLVWGGWKLSRRSRTAHPSHAAS